MHYFGSDAAKNSAELLSYRQSPLLEMEICTWLSPSTNLKTVYKRGPGNSSPQVCSNYSKILLLFRPLAIEGLPGKR